MGLFCSDNSTHHSLERILNSVFVKSRSMWFYCSPLHFKRLKQVPTAVSGSGVVKTSSSPISVWWRIPPHILLCSCPPPLDTTIVPLPLGQLLLAASRQSPLAKSALAVGSSPHLASLPYQLIWPRAWPSCHSLWLAAALAAVSGCCTLTSP